MPWKGRAGLSLRQKQAAPCAPLATPWRYEQLCCAALLPCGMRAGCNVAAGQAGRERTHT